MFVLVFSRHSLKTKTIERKWKRPWSHLDYHQIKCENTMKNDMKIVLIKTNSN